MVEPRLLNRLKHLSRPAHERWEGGLVRLPMWIEEGGPDGRPFRPWAAMWVSPLQHKIDVRLLDPGEDTEQALIRSFVDFATKTKLAGCLASTIHVRDDGQADVLRAALGTLPVEVVVRPELPHLNGVIDQMLTESGSPPVPAMLDAPGVTVEALRAFADAARAFWLAQPWQELQTSDVMRIEAPDLGPPLRFATVLGSEGTLRGVGFYGSVDEHDAVSRGIAPPPDRRRRQWLLSFGQGWEMAPQDVDAWERESLPLAADDAWPLLISIDPRGSAHRPDAGQLAWFEGLLRAIAAAPPDDLDAGRWTTEVDTSQGRMRFQLALPALTDTPDAAFRQDEEQDGPTFFQGFLQSRELDALRDARGDASPEHQALALAFRARDAGGRRQLQMARRALALWPDCADAHLVLGDREDDSERALVHYEAALQAAERTLPPHATLDPAPEDVFGADPLTRPYLRARARVGDALLALDRYEEARDHLRALLRLDGNDALGQRIRLLEAAIARGDHETGREMRRMFPDDDSPLMLYGSALLEWSAGDRIAARSLLREAIARNRRALKYLDGREPVPDVHIALFKPGDESEAIIIAQHFAHLWADLPGAIQWLQETKR